MAKIIQLFPATNQPILNGSQPTNDYSYNMPGNANVHQGDVRVDFRLSDKDTLFGSTSWSDTGKSQTSPLPGVLDNTGQTGVTEYDLARNGQMSYSRVWTPTLVTESRVSFSRLVTFRADAANRHRRILRHSVSAAITQLPLMPITADSPNSPRAVTAHSAPATGRPAWNTATFWILSRTS